MGVLREEMQIVDRSTARWWSLESSLMEKMWTGRRRKSGSNVGSSFAALRQQAETCTSTLPEVFLYKFRLTGSSLFLTALAMLFVHVVRLIRGPADPDSRLTA